MKTKFLSLIFLSGLTVIAFGQNQFDSNGKKNGRWTIYLNNNWKEISDSSKASFYRYNYFDHGANIYPMGPCGKKGYKLETPNNSKLLDGEYKWFDEKGNLNSVHVLKNGEYVSCKEYFPSGQLSQHFDYTKKCEGHELGWTLFIYDTKGNLTLTSPLCKDKNGEWPLTR